MLRVYSDETKRKDAARKRLWYYANWEREKAKRRAHARVINPKRNAYKRDWYWKNHERLFRKAKAYRIVNRDSFSRYQKKWLESNPEYKEIIKQRTAEWYHRQIGSLSDKYVSRALKLTGRNVTPEAIERCRREIAAKRFRRIAKYFAAAESLAGKENPHAH